MHMRGSGVDYVTSIYSHPALFAKLSDSSDQDFIGEVIANIDDNGLEAKLFLVMRNRNLTEDNLRVLAKDENLHVRAAVAQHNNTPVDVLDRFLTEESERVRVQVLWNPQTSMEVFAKAVLRGKFSNSNRIGFCSNDKAVRNFEVFDFLWNTVRGSHVRLVENLNYAVQEKHEVIDPRILHVVHETVRKENVSKTLKESYAGAVIALPEILDDWKDDPYRPVINAIARNSSAWVSTHDYLVTKHKTAVLRVAVAGATKNYALLNKIHQGTKSETIRAWVERNPAFVDASEG